MVPAEAFYEWVGPKGRRQPLSIGRADGKLLSMAGLFNYWKAKDSEGSPIHDRTEPMDDAHSQPHARHIAGRSD